MPSKAEYWKNPEKWRRAASDYRVANPEWKRKSSREWAAKARAERPEKLEADRAAARKYRATHAETCVARTLAWAHRHPGRYLYYNAKGRAKKLGLPFDIAPEDIVIPTYCPVLGIKIDPVVRGRKGFHPMSPSVDRVIPSRGYVRGNVRVISNRANRLKCDASIDEVRAVLRYMETALQDGEGF